MKWLICVIFICGILNEVKAQSYDKFLDRLLDYQKHVRVKDSLINGKYIASIDTNTFDLKDYMSIFSKLTPEPGYIIEYIYDAGWDGAVPLLYAWRENLNKEEYISAEKERIIRKCDSTINERVEKIRREDLEKDAKIKKIERTKRIFTNSRELSCKRILHSFALDLANHAAFHLTPQDNKMGYLQLLIFKLYGNNFALWWHANYGYRFPVYKKEQIEFLIKKNRENDFSIYFTEKEIRPLLTAKLKPQIKMERTRCVISLYVFYAGSGLYRKTYSISRTNPYLITEKKSEKLVSNSFHGFF